MNLTDPRDLAPLLEAFLLASGKAQSLERLYELFEEAERARAAQPKRQQPVGKQRAKKQQQSPKASGTAPRTTAKPGTDSPS